MSANPSDNIHEIDKLLIDSIQNNKNKLSYSDSFNIWEVIQPTSIKAYINSLEFILNKTNNTLYKTTKYKISCLLSNFFAQYNIVEKNFSKTFISNNIDYLIEENIFYSKFFKFMLSDKNYLTFFNFIPNQKHIDFYISTSKNIKRDLDDLHSYMNSSQYNILKTSDYIFFINFLDVMSVYSQDIDDNNRLKLFENIEPLFISLTAYIYNNILTNRDHIKIYKLVSSKKLTKNQIQLQINALEKDINIYMNWLTILLNNELFIEYSVVKYDGFNITNTPNNHIVDLAPILTQDWFGELQTECLLENLSNQILLNDLDNIFNKKNINVHILSKLVNDSNKQIFYNETSVKSLILFYNKLEDYGEETGFYEKNITRDRIINILSDYINNNYNNKIIKIDNKWVIKDTKIHGDKSKHINLKNLFTNFHKDIVNKYIILLISDFCEILNSITINDLTVSILNTYKCCASLYKLYDYYSVLLYIVKIIDSDDNIIVSKVCELIHCIFYNCYNKRIFRDVYELKQSGIGLDFTSELLSNQIENFLVEFYKDINSIFSKKCYMNYFATHEELYNRSEIENTLKIIGFLQIDDNLTVNTIINTYITSLDQHIFEYSKSCAKYSEEIPTEFLDPIYYIPISDPLELPETKTIVDKQIIINHLFFKHTNPFNGLELTQEVLFKYNTKEEVISRLESFKQKFSNWKYTHKI